MKLEKKLRERREKLQRKESEKIDEEFRKFKDSFKDPSSYSEKEIRDAYNRLKAERAYRKKQEEIKQEEIKKMVDVPLKESFETKIIKDGKKHG